MAHDEYEHQRRQTAALERIVELLETKIAADDPPHCGNRTLTGDHHAVCDCPDGRVENPPDDQACTTNRTEQQ